MLGDENTMGYGEGKCRSQNIINPTPIIPLIYSKTFSSGPLMIKLKFLGKIKEPVSFSRTQFLQSNSSSLEVRVVDRTVFSEQPSPPVHTLSHYLTAPHIPIYQPHQTHYPCRAILELSYTPALPCLIPPCNLEVGTWTCDLLNLLLFLRLKTCPAKRDLKANLPLKILLDGSDPQYFLDLMYFYFFGQDLQINL